MGTLATNRSNVSRSVYGFCDKNFSAVVPGVVPARNKANTQISVNHPS